MLVNLMNLNGQKLNLKLQKYACRNSTIWLTELNQ